jgi:hypothetical protein
MSSLFSLSEDIESLGRNLAKIKPDRSKIHQSELSRLLPAMDAASLGLDEDGYINLPDQAHPSYQSIQEYLSTSLCVPAKLHSKTTNLTANQIESLFKI